MKRKWDKSDEHIRRKCAEAILTRIEEQGDADFGLIAAEDIIDIVTSTLGPDIYNAALEDVKKLVQNKTADLEVEMDLLRNVG